MLRKLGRIGWKLVGGSMYFLRLSEERRGWKLEQENDKSKNENGRINITYISRLCRALDYTI